MSSVKNNTPIVKRDGSIAENHTIRVYRRDTGQLLSSVKTANIVGATQLITWNSTGNDSSWSGYTIRTIIDKSLLAIGNRVRVTLSASSSASAIVGTCYIGSGASTGDVYDFDVAPTQALFSGNSGITVNAGESVVSDWVSLSTNGTKNLIVAVYFSGVSDVRYATNTNAPGWQTYSANNNTPNIIDTSGYSTDGLVYFITGVEINNTALLPGYYHAPCADYLGDVNVVCLDESGTSNDLITKTSSI